MRFLNLLQKPQLHLVRLPSGSFTIDCNGRILVSTLPGSFPEAWVNEIGQRVLAALLAAHEAQVQLAELVVEYSTLKLTARSLRGGAIIFLAPQGLGRKP
jgi:hypothetical protein